MAPACGVGTRPPASAAQPAPRSAPAPVSPPAAAPPDPPPQDAEEERAGEPRRPPRPRPSQPQLPPLLTVPGGAPVSPPRFTDSQHAPKGGEGSQAGGVQLAASSLDLGIQPAPEHSDTEPPGEKPLGWGVGVRPVLTLLPPLWTQSLPHRPGWLPSQMQMEETFPCPGAYQVSFPS